MFERKIIRHARRMGAIVFAAAVVALGGCGPAEPEVSPPVEVPESFSASGPDSPSERWWEDLGDAALDSLMARALGENLTLRAAWNRLSAAEAAARSAGSAKYPTLDANASAGVQQAESDNPAQDGSSTPFSLGLMASYEVDLWGRVAATADAAGFDRAASREDLTAAAISVSGQVASTWYSLVAGREQLAILREQLRANEETLELVMLRFRRGQVGAEDVLRQQQTVESRRGELARAEASVAVSRHRLAVLLGQPPNAPVVPEGGALPQLSDVPDAGLPADLINRRPDVRSAYYSVLAADRRVAAAVAQRFPRLSLSAQASTSSDGPTDLFTNWLANLTANLAAPIIDGGRRRAEVDRAKASAAAALDSYGQTVLTAFREVEDALVQERTQTDYVTSLEQQVELAEQVVDRTRQNYLNGSGTYLNVLSAQQTYQSLQRSLLEAKRARVDVRISLYRAIAGGWEMTQPPPRRVTSTQNTSTDDRIENDE